LDVILEISNGTDKVAVEIISNGSQRKIRLGGTEIPCDWARLADDHYSMILDGNVLDILVNVDHETCVITSRSGVYSFRVVDPRRPGFMQASEEVSAGIQRLCADMPGKIIRVLVQAGDTVALDQNLLVLEAMKMQNEIRAPKSGVVKEVAVPSGTIVNTGDFLLSIES
jgi:biotin carboxyl carrier protein